MSVKRLLRDPLVHFLLIGACLFALGRGEEQVEPEDRRIEVSAGRVEQMATVFTRTWMRPPTEEELRALVRDYALEEIHCRQALAMGLDRDDPVIRRRLRQKLEFLIEDEQALEPTDSQLAAFLAAHAERFRVQPRASFEQVYVSLDRHGERTDDVAADLLAELRAGRLPAGDPTLLPATFQRATAREIDTQLGLGFAAGLEGLPLGEWQGPLRSRLGLHLVRVDAREPGRGPELAEVREAVAREWAAARRDEIRREREERLLDAYEIVIEWAPVAAGPE